MLAIVVAGAVLLFVALELFVTAYCYSLRGGVGGLASGNIFGLLAADCASRATASRLTLPAMTNSAVATK